ncbi:MAG: molybdopterin molybdotransferase MoeA [Isosphaeraceae bacterium]|nr:molybdopterin molybdotransferase MoeA [Isosphaeraceae bacterium]
MDNRGESSSEWHDPRGRGFRDRASVADVLALIDRRVSELESETLPLGEAYGRILAEPAVAGSPVPPFDRAAMDGYAVRGEETFGASSYNPIAFRCAGEAFPGRRCRVPVIPGDVVAIATGAALPAGADAVVKHEATQRTGDVVLVTEPTPPGRHVGRAGEDITAGTLILPRSRMLRPQDVGVLSAVGAARVAVVRRPRVTVLVTGDELLPAGSPAVGDRIPDMNGVMLAALIHRDGGTPAVVGPLPDDRDRLERALLQAVENADAVLVSGGSSTGPEDYAPGLVRACGELAVHGVALRPASPSGFGFIRGKPVVLLPGNPVSCLCAYDFFAGRAIRRLGGRRPDLPYRAISLPLARKLVSVVGRLDYARVRVVDSQVEPLAISGASILSSTTRADGFVLVPSELEGYAAGSMVSVWLYDE